MRQLRRTADVSKEFNEIYRALTSDAKLGNDWWDLFATKSILLRLVSVCTACVLYYCTVCRVEIVVLFARDLPLYVATRMPCGCCNMYGLGVYENLFCNPI